MATKLSGKTRGLYLLSMATGSDGTTTGGRVTIEIWVVDGGIEGGVCGGVVRG